MLQINGQFAFEHSHSLHLWPRDDCMLIAFPNNDKSFTASFFAKQNLFDQLKDRVAIAEFFQVCTPVARPLSVSMIPSSTPIEHCIKPPNKRNSKNYNLSRSVPYYSHYKLTLVTTGLCLSVCVNGNLKLHESESAVFT